MKEITRIHLARTPFNVEIDAKKALEKYLTEIQGALGADDDTMREIEARVVEILAEHDVASEQTITVADVEAIEARLGAPSDFIDESEVGVSSTTKSEKRLMRDTNRGMLGGVSAGIADYFGVSVVWPRLVMILLIFVSFGTAILIYVVLWLVVPPARTATEKLQMRGEPVTLASLKDQASEVAITSERSKPLVIGLRVLLGLGFMVASLGAIGFVIMAIFVRKPLFDTSISSLMTDGVLSMIGVAYIAAIIAVFLFIVLMALASYVSFTWKINKKLLVSGGIIIALGLASFAVAFGFGIHGADQFNRQLEQSKTTDTISATQLGSGIKRMAFTTSQALSVEYHVTHSTPHIEIQYLHGQGKPKLTVAYDGDQAIITAKEGGNCNLPGMLCTSYERVVVYGPALDEVSIKSGTINYFPDTQSQLTVDISEDAQLYIEGGHVTSLKGTTSSGSELVAEDSTISLASLNVATGATISLGAVDTLTLTTPKLCNEDNAEVTYRSVNTFTINDKAVTSVSDANSCVSVNQDR